MKETKAVLEESACPILFIEGLIASYCSRLRDFFRDQDKQTLLLRILHSKEDTTIITWKKRILSIDKCNEDKTSMTKAECTVIG